jgi:hypothetical protein
VAFVPLGEATEKPNTGWLQILPNGHCELNKNEFPCDRVVPRLRSMHLAPEWPVTVIVDDAPYESVAAVLDALDKAGMEHFVLPPFFGTNPSKSVNHWIRLVVEGLVNHPFPMVLISADSFRTWRETLVVLPPQEFAIVDGLATARIGQPDCLQSPAALPMDLRGKEHRLWLFNHADERTQSCLIPRAAASCGFLSTVMSQANIHWSAGDLEAIHLVAGEIGCK